MSAEATILIKKSDGTSERISLAEFRARQKKTEPVAPVLKEQGTISPVKSSLRDGRGAAFNGVNKEQFIAKPEIKKEPIKTLASFTSPMAGLVTMVPKKQEIIFAQGGSASGGRKDDTASLLEEPLIEGRPDVPLASQSRVSQADEIINKLNFRAPDQIRLRGLIQLRLKDVRGEEETRNWLIRSVQEGGAGLKAEEAEEVLKLCRGESIKKSVISEIKPLKKGAAVAIIGAKKNRLPSAYREPPTPAVIQNKKPFFTLPAIKEVKDLRDLRKISAQGEPDSVLNSNLNDISKKQSARPIVRDILPANKTSVGPTDEISSMTLTDFRRLSINPSEAMIRLKQKFINLKNESCLLYLEALSAWRNSPLYKEYIGVIIQSLNQNVRLSALLTDKIKIQMPEIAELIKMENGF